MAKHIVRQSLLAVSVISSMMAFANAAETINEETKVSDKSDETVKLETIVVTASGSGVNVKDAPASISVITSEEIAKRPVSSIANLLGELPGAVGGYSNVGPGFKSCVSWCSR